MHNCKRPLSPAMSLAVILVVLPFCPGARADGIHADSAVVKVNIQNVTLRTATVDHLESFTVAGKYVAIRRQPPGDTTSVVTVLDGLSGDTLWSVSHPCKMVSVSKGQRPTLIVETSHGEGSFQNWIYDLDGTLLFSKNHALGALVSSPNGIFFHNTCCDDHCGCSPVVWDRVGREVFSDTSRYKEDWVAHFLGDSTLVVTSPGLVRFFRLPSGDLILNRLVNQLPHVMPGFITCVSGSRMALVTRGLSTDSLVRFDDHLVAEKSVPLNGFFIAGAIAPSDKYAVVLVASGDDHRAKLLNLQPGAAGTTTDLGVIPLGLNCSSEAVRWVSNLVRISSNWCLEMPHVLGPNDLGLQTDLFVIDTLSGAVLGHQVLQGQVEMTNVGQILISVGRMHYGSSELTVSTWTVQYENK